MAYVGGKSKGSEHIIDILNDKKYDNMKYLEPFVGYGHILRRVNKKKSYTACDINPLVISLLKGIQDKTKRYPNISKNEYYILKNKTNHSFKRAIAAFAYSYNGKEWGGYTENSKCGTRESYPQERKNYYDKLRQNDTFMKTKISLCDYRTIRPRNYLIYCDPPYINTTGYGDIKFNHKEFWDTIRKWSKDNTVFVSEYKAPSDFKCVAKKGKHQSLGGKGADKIVYEKLFTIKPKK